MRKKGLAGARVVVFTMMKKKRDEGRTHRGQGSKNVLGCPETNQTLMQNIGVCIGRGTEERGGRKREKTKEKKTKTSREFLKKKKDEGASRGW